MVEFLLTLAVNRQFSAPYFCRTQRSFLETNILHPSKLKTPWKLITVTTFCQERLINFGEQYCGEKSDTDVSVLSQPIVSTICLGQKQMCWTLICSDVR